MKYLILFLFLAAGLTVGAQEKQSLKDLLYGGKLKKDSSGVIRSTDDYSSKIDTTRKDAIADSLAKKEVMAQASKPVEAEKKAATPQANTANKQNNTVTTDTRPSATSTTNPVAPPPVAPLPVATGVIATTAAGNVANDSTVAGSLTNDNAANTDIPKEPVATAPKTNTKLWKEYSDALTKTLQTDVLKNKQVKKETYFMMFEYEIGTDGQVSFLNVTSEPGNAFLQSQVKQILDSTPLKLNPVLDSANQPRKVKRKQSFSITKD